ncbi:ABC transporter ATP-binding protein [Streptomyces montanisoli]|uniref:ATP-binding cassette domain-containing protein n=1 Tax=Streptomyces montanisoli TaxID=2798581 RepID=A0A940RV12_9ACTN|nr:ATP-binding cassette domain-containing protein [Streptomyces montanisoli]MBP0458557.1 ATP-binding cassette domain-containing protein [Streptomyces montanisoli]
MSATDVLLECRDASRTFGGGPTAVVAVQGVNCRIRAGERMAITGASGSGKSTLLHLIAGLEEPTGGTVLRSGPFSAQDVGMIFQGPSLIPALTVAENVALPLVVGGASEETAHAAALAALRLTAIADLAEHLPEEISGGQGQRAAVARVLALAPRLILADEPTGRLDGVTGQRVLDTLLSAADATGAALVVTTHDPAIAARMTTRLAMHGGRLVDVQEEKS